MKTDWKALRSQIPNRVQVARKVWYEICWIEEFTDPIIYGETRYDDKQIVLKLGLSPKETVLTYWHELHHAFSEEYNVGLTENQVINLESAGNYFLKPENLFRPRKKE